jgi:hypothetical protein
MSPQRRSRHSLVGSVLAAFLLRAGPGSLQRCPRHPRLGLMGVAGAAGAVDDLVGAARLNRDQRKASAPLAVRRGAFLLPGRDSLRRFVVLLRSGLRDHKLPPILPHNLQHVIFGFNECQPGYTINAHFAALALGATACAHSARHSSTSRAFALPHAGLAIAPASRRQRCYANDEVQYPKVLSWVRRRKIAST